MPFSLGQAVAFLLALVVLFLIIQLAITRIPILV